MAPATGPPGEAEEFSKLAFEAALDFKVAKKPRFFTGLLSELADALILIQNCLKWKEAYKK